jgi:hypothetical protein
MLKANTNSTSIALFSFQDTNSKIAKEKTIGIAISFKSLFLQKTGRRPPFQLE